MFNHNDLLIEKLARAHHAERLKEAEISRLPVAQAAKTDLSKHKLALVLMGALLAALLMAQLAAAAAGAGGGAGRCLLM
ncbi:MAG TPA: hypothetical protein VFL17_21565 [Anaerolineae bacterium]|nr:hypothetical protein [Anaerolineae bacterium]